MHIIFQPKIIASKVESSLKIEAQLMQQTNIQTQNIHPIALEEG